MGEIVHLAQKKIEKEKKLSKSKKKAPDAQTVRLWRLSLEIDDLIKKVSQYGYAHHIERLMYLSNFMLLCRIHPDDMYKWFMEMFIDSYNWVMVGNVYAMSSYAAGALLMTRPYFSSSNYIAKMSSYKKKPIDNVITIDNDVLQWYEIWDILYYAFVGDNSGELSKNYATAISAKLWTQKTNSEKIKIRQYAKKYLKQYIA